MNLTQETIDLICDYARQGNMIEAIKTLRYAWPIGLREARDFMQKYHGDVSGLRQALRQLANLKEGMVFENSYLRIELKAADATFEDIQPFLIQVLESLYPKMTTEQMQQFFLKLIGRHSRPSVEELQRFSEGLFDKFYPEFNEPDEVEA